MQRRLIWVTLFSVAIVVTALYQTRKVHATPVQDDHHGCSVASLKGTYAFHRTGVNNVVGGPIAQIGINVEDGEGKIKLIRTTRSSNGVILWLVLPGHEGCANGPDDGLVGSTLHVDVANMTMLIDLHGAGDTSVPSWN